MAERRRTGVRRTTKRTVARSTTKEKTARSGKVQTLGRGKSLVIVESPAKARTIGPILGSSFVVEASLGHVRDLPKSTLGVSVDDEFMPKYLIPREKKALVNQLKSYAKTAKTVYLATDPDREGEAIAWHLVQAGEMEDRPLQRVVFHEITPEAIKEAFEHPLSINMDLVYAQQARRILDRLVGYSLSPVLWKKVRSGLSAGRVQSVALRMIVEREREVRSFTPQEYWTIDAELGKALPAAGRRSAKADSFVATLVNLAGKRGRIAVNNQTSAQKLVADLKASNFKVASITKKDSQRQPQAPFTTSTLQQEAARKLGFTAQRTMAVAQQLYEGLNVGQGGSVGLITYLRTDSVRVAETAIDQARTYIRSAFGGDFVPKSPRRYTQRSKGAQEAHEAIRPTSIARTPGEVRSVLTADQRRLYELIWKRMVASQMANANLETTSADVEATKDASKDTYILRSSETRVVFPGYQTLYQESQDDDDQDQDSPKRGRRDAAAALLASLQKGDALDLRQIDPLQHFTQPPPRFSDASLVKALEANGIGRPSTYAAIIGTLQGRGYVHREQRQLVPQELGEVVNDLLTEHFPEVVDIGFTARLEGELDDIAAGDQTWVPVVREFYQPFSKNVEQAYEEIQKIKLTPEYTGDNCELCGSQLLYRVGRYGRFIACSGFPACRFTKPILKLMNVKCPRDEGELVEKRGRQGRRIFYGCANFPACEFTSWDKPIPQPCPSCGGMLTEPRRGRAKCTQCDYTGVVPSQTQGDPSRELVAAGRS